jgi:prepilin-type N-terminal cleavage/methylation domain-containing protein
MNILNKLGVKRSSQAGFTLIEILVVIGIIAVLAVIVLIAINPARQFAQARNTQRVSNVNAIINAIGQRIADCKGTFEGTCGGITCPTLPTTATAIGTTLDSCLAPTYINEVPVDPKSGAAGYTVAAPTGGRITVAAPGAELNETISITR